LPEIWENGFAGRSSVFLSRKNGSSFNSGSLFHQETETFAIGSYIRQFPAYPTAQSASVANHSRNKRHSKLDH
ncbi:MAG: hypothetical protein RBR22_05880, partial [Desulfuromonas sp.]|nr:hypothetical protein [Desulfuromonas sp.]